MMAVGEQERTCPEIAEPAAVELALLQRAGISAEALSQLAEAILADRRRLAEGPDEDVFWRKIERITRLEEIALALAARGA